MKELKIAIRYAIVNNAALTTRCPGGFHWGVAPSKSLRWPYIVAESLPVLDIECDTGTTVLERHHISISVFTHSQEIADDIGAVIMAVFEGHAPSLSRGKCLHVIVNNHETTLDPDPGDDGSDVWVCRTEFEFFVERPTTV